MNIEELLTQYTDLTHKRDEAYEVYRSFETRINYLAHDNKLLLKGAFRDCFQHYYLVDC